MFKRVNALLDLCDQTMDWKDVDLMWKETLWRRPGGLERKRGKEGEEDGMSKYDTLNIYTQQISLCINESS